MVLHLNSNDPRSLYLYETRQSKKGRPTQKKYFRRNRAGNCQTLSLGQCIVALEKKGVNLPAGIRQNLDAIIEVRDNAVHYVSAGPLLAKQIFEFGTASVANFIALAREWFGLDLSKYHLYLMPIGFVAPPANVESIVVSSDEAQLIQYLASLTSGTEVHESEPYQVALNVQVKMKKSSTDGALKVAITDDPNAPKVFLKEEDFKARYPWDYAQLTERLRRRYTDFKAAEKYHKLRKSLMGDSRFSMSRFLDPGNPKSAKKDFFSPQILDEFDKAFTLKDKTA